MCSWYKSCRHLIELSPLKEKMYSMANLWYKKIKIIEEQINCPELTKPSDALSWMAGSKSKIRTTIVMRFGGSKAEAIRQRKEKFNWKP
jgi:hypothetical protein